MNDEALRVKYRQATRTKRLRLQHGLVSILDGLFKLTEGSNADNFVHFVNVSRQDASQNILAVKKEVESKQVEEELEDESIKMEMPPASPIPEGAST